MPDHSTQALSSGEAPGVFHAKTAYRRGERSKAESTRPGSPRGSPRLERSSPFLADGGRHSRSGLPFIRDSLHQPRARSPSDQEDGPSQKRKKSLVDESKYPWGLAGSIVKKSLPPDVQQTLDLLDNWSNDPSYVVRKIMIAPGCPDFPEDQWNNIVKGLSVDLEKVLGAYHSPKSSKVVLTYGDWSVAFGRTVQAVAFAFPHRRGEYTQYQNHISQLFASVQPPFHSKVVEFDKAVRRKAANQRFLRLTNYAEYEELRIVHLGPLGTGSHSGEWLPERSRRGEKGAGPSPRLEPCHKWNRGACTKSAEECGYEHYCDRRNCRGAHRRLEHSSSGAKRGDRSCFQVPPEVCLGVSPKSFRATD